jgi:hypothetical protein
MNRRQRQIGENEAIFRSVNEQIQSLNSTLTTVTDTMRIVCECGNRSCTDQFAIMPADYASVREDPTLFLTRPGHDFPETETVVAKEGDYWVVRKDPGLPEAIARATDPRGG